MPLLFGAMVVALVLLTMQLPTDTAPRGTHSPKAIHTHS
jgi:hypothetical protein